MVDLTEPYCRQSAQANGAVQGLADETGADAAAASALDADGLFSQLWEQSAGIEGGS